MEQRPEEGRRQRLGFPGLRPVATLDTGGTMIFVSHDRMFLRGLGSRVLQLGGESGSDHTPVVYPGSYIEYVQMLGHEAPGIYSCRLLPSAAERAIQLHHR